MNGSEQTVAAGEPCAGKVPWRQVIAILAAAFALGLVYNVVSPLGVRAPKPETQAAVPLTGSNAPIVRPTALVSTNPGNTLATLAALTTNAFAIRWIEVKPLLESGQIVLLDARAKTAYDLEHIPGALSLPTESKPEDFIAFAMKYPKDTAIVVYCGGGNCDESHELAGKLRKDLGYTNVRGMPGGIVEYRLATSKSTAAGTKPATSGETGGLKR